jgi:hypothetical protein
VNNFNCHHSKLSVFINVFLPQIPYLTGRNHVPQELPLRSRTALIHFSTLEIVSSQLYRLLI